MTEKAIYSAISIKYAQKYKTKKGRQRPRNPQERETLLRWERERSGKKIGEI